MENDRGPADIEAAVDTTSDFVVDADGSEASCEIQELNPHRLAQRQKQIDYGKNTPGYESYITKVPKERRQPSHPQTPDTKQAVSKRGFDYQVKKWRRRLHGWDPKAAPGQESVHDGLSSQGSMGFRTPRSGKPTPEHRGSWGKTPSSQQHGRPHVSPAPLGAWSGGKPSPLPPSAQKPVPPPPGLQVKYAGGKENALHSLKRPQPALSPQGRPEAKRATPANWADEVEADALEGDLYEGDIYGDWSIEEGMEDATAATMSVRLEA